MEKFITRDKILKLATEEACRTAAEEYPDDRKERIKLANRLIMMVLKTTDIIFT